MRNQAPKRLCALAVTAAVLVEVSCAPSPAPAAPDASVQATPERPSHASILPSAQSIADVAAAVTPAVVNVFSEKSVTLPNGEERGPFPFFQDPFFHYYFNQPGRRFREAPSRREQSLGSGVIVSPDGIIITNNHVVAQAEKIRVALKDGRELEAKLVGTDPKSDVAVLRVDATGLPALPVADSSKIRIGDLVLAIGNPFGIGQTVTMGIISAVGRANMGITDYEDFIQTDAAINPGNSGGALVNMEGQWVGINTAIVSRSGGYQGIGFAIPSNMAVQVKDALLQNGKVVRGWLGVAIQDVTEELAQALSVKSKAGVLVSDVTEDGPAAKAGLKRGDIITAIDGTKTHDTAHLRNLVALAGKGKKVQVELIRNGSEKTFEVTLGEAPSDQSASGGAPVAEDEGLFAGVTVQDLDPAARAKLRAPPDLEGVVVAEISPRSAASRMGLRPGDVILEVNRIETPTVDAFRKVAKESPHRALLLVYRDGVTIFMSVAN